MPPAEALAGGVELEVNFGREITRIEEVPAFMNGSCMGPFRAMYYFQSLHRVQGVVEG